MKLKNIILIILIAIVVLMGVIIVIFGLNHNDNVKSTSNSKHVQPNDNEPSTSIYVKLYDDGTLAFTATDKVLKGKTVVNSYGDIYGKEFSSVEDILWINEAKDIKSVNIVDKISPKSTTYWFTNLEELTKIENISNLDTSKVTDMGYMFYGCRLLTSLDISSFDTSKVVYSDLIFNKCTNLKDIYIGDKWTLEKTDNRMKIKNLENNNTKTSDGDTSNSTHVQPNDNETSNSIYVKLYDDGTLAFTSTDKVLEGKTVVKSYGDIYGKRYDRNLWFQDFLYIKSVNIVDKISPTSTEYWFDHLGKLTKIENISNLDTSEVTNMSFMFSDCYSLTSLDVSRFDTSKVTYMSYMFYGCSSLTSLDISSFDTSKVTDMSFMFSRCTSLTSLDVSRFDTSKVTDIGNMFDECKALTSLDVSSFDTSNVTYMVGMFENCIALTSLDLSSFDTSKVIHSDAMFYECRNLKDIYIGDKWTLEKTDSRMKMK